MKSTYKLFGVFWDRKEHKGIKECRVIQFTHGIDYKKPFCLFDLLDEYRTIGIKELLSIEDDTEFSNICNRLREFKQIAIVIDYTVDYSSVVASEYYLKSLSQIYFALSNALPDCSIVIAVPTEKTQEWLALQEYDY